MQSCCYYGKHSSRIAHRLFVSVFRIVCFLLSMTTKLRRPNMLLLLSTIELVFVFICLFSQCSAGTSPRGARKEMNRDLNTGVRSLSFDSDDENAEEHQTPSRAASRQPPPPVRSFFSDDEDEGHGASSSGTSSGTSGRSSIQQRMHRLRSSEVESQADRSLRHQRRPTTSEVWERENLYKQWHVFV